MFSKSEPNVTVMLQTLLDNAEKDMEPMTIRFRHLYDTAKRMQCPSVDEPVNNAEYDEGDSDIDVVPPSQKRRMR